MRRFIVALLAVALASCGTLAPAQEAKTAAKYRASVTREVQFRFGIPVPVPVIAAQIHQESGFNPDTVSRTGAAGLMQFMPGTAKWAATANAWGAPNVHNPEWSIRAGVWYDKWLIDRVTGDTLCDRWSYALSAYNGGLGYVYKRQRLSDAPGAYERTAKINPGIHPENQRENESYAPRILRLHQPKYIKWGGQTICL